ncbi:MAG: single-stranded DNA-binding protein [Candidatus Thermoplasmatota archaeon]|jgi:replication factor A1|nr:single-stranded DNA-binding protein [Candidatus Thermoplasmatota archaeon]MCW6168887.1 single-stranded DNA-binding protein [Thermoplasmatales archaeon]MCW6170487.1 single-stranded DNA-binding protein [Thermoplasmatales archaeon]
MEGVTKIKDLTPESRSVNILAKVLSKSEPKAIQTKFGEEKSVTEVYIGDDTGKVILSLWGDQAAQTSDGQVVYIDNGYVSLVRGHIRLNVGKYGSLKPSEEELGEVNTELDVSEAEHENTYRKSYNRSYGNRGNRNYRGRNDEN